MQRNLLEYLERSQGLFPEKTAFANADTALTFGQLYAAARAVGSYLTRFGRRQPVAVFMEKHPNTVAAFCGVLYSGNYYVPLDAEMSLARIGMILENARPAALLCDAKSAELVAQTGYGGEVLLYADARQAAVDNAALADIRRGMLDVDPAYVVFTSGSTGTPKGVVACHRNVIDYVDALSDVLAVNESTVFGNQVPLYVDACLKEIYPTMKYGATTHFIPKSHFLFPLKLIEYINQQGINTVCWVVSALTLVSGFGALEKAVPHTLSTVAFGSEVFPIRQFNLWRKALPEARFINLYGPTEATGMSCCYEVDRTFTEGEAIPIGRPFPNTGVLLLDEAGNQVQTPETPGEMYIRGAGVTLGYYNDPQRTAEVYLQNPLHALYPETVYRTGDMAKYNELGELIYLSRKDHQIKHMGYRIELMEIEAAAARMEGIAAACCVFDAARSKIVLYYAGEAEQKQVLVYMRRMLPRYMAPAAVIKLERLPLTQNGKVDRAGLAAQAARQD